MPCFHDFCLVNQWPFSGKIYNKKGGYLGGFYFSQKFYLGKQSTLLLTFILFLNYLLKLYDTKKYTL